PRSQPAGGDRIASGREGTRARGRPRVPDAGRRQGGRRARARAPADRRAGGSLVGTDRGADRRGGARKDACSGVTRRGRSVVALGLVVYLAAWAFGSKPLYPVATGLLLVSAVAWGWLHLANRPFRVRRGSGDSEHVEGDDVPVVVELESTGRVLPAAATLAERIGRLGEQRHALRRPGARPASASTRCATTSTATPCGVCTGGRRRAGVS